MRKKGKRQHTDGGPRDRTFKPAELIGNALAAENDRGCVLVAYSYIEHSLEWLLRAHFNQFCPLHPREDAEEFLTKSEEALDPDNPGALLGSGAPRLRIALLVGLIDLPTLRLANAFRNMRIRCAHDFNTVAID